MLKTVAIVALLLLRAEAQLFSGVFNTLSLFTGEGRVFGNSAGFQYEYDFVVVGAGSGGSVVANRLTENQNWTVLLLEAGEDENIMTDIPIMAAFQSSTKYNWGYKSERTKGICMGLVDKRCNTPRGKALGGTSVINFLLYTRGNKQDYNEWEEMGNTGWGYKDILKYFIKSEDCSRCKSIDRDYHGTSGYLKIEHPHINSPLLKRFLKAGIEMGYRNTDPNGRNHLGFSEAQATMHNGRRCSANKAFIKPILNRPNLQVTPKARVTKILINPTTKRAYGVEVLRNKEMFVVRARKEVILSAGTMNSPHLLMLSGVGPKEELQKAKINPIQELKVGYNLQDHVSFNGLLFLINQTIAISDRQLQNPADVINYLANGEGPFTIPGGALGMGFVQTKYAERLEYPDIELVLGAGGLNGDIYGTLRRTIGFTEEFDRVVFAPHRNRPGFGLTVVLMRPKSRGRILLRDGNPLHWPLLYPNYFQNEDDLNVMVEGIKKAIEVSKTTSFRSINAHLNDIPFPGCSHIKFNTDPYWKCALRHVGNTLGHHVGTCKMGPDYDSDAVVDSRLRVRGITGLRVVDASIMPNVVAGHTNSVVMMIGEKASDMIKEDWR